MNSQLRIADDVASVVEDVLEMVEMIEESDRSEGVIPSKWKFTVQSRWHFCSCSRWSAQTNRVWEVSKALKYTNNMEIVKNQRHCCSRSCQLTAEERWGVSTCSFVSHISSKKAIIDHAESTVRGRTQSNSRLRGEYMTHNQCLTIQPNQSWFVQHGWFHYSLGNQWATEWIGWEVCAMNAVNFYLHIGQNRRRRRFGGSRNGRSDWGGRQIRVGHSIKL